MRNGCIVDIGQLNQVFAAVGHDRSKMNLSTYLFALAIVLALSGCVATTPTVKGAPNAEELKTEDIGEQRRRWGALADAAGNSFVREFTYLHQYKALKNTGYRFEWIVPGVVLRESDYRNGAESREDSTIYQFDPSTASIKLLAGGRLVIYEGRPASDGSILLEGRWPGHRDMRLSYDSVTGVMTHSSPQGAIGGRWLRADERSFAAFQGLIREEAAAGDREAKRLSQERFGELMGALTRGVQAAAQDQAVINQRRSQLQSAGTWALQSAPAPSSRPPTQQQTPQSAPRPSAASNATAPISRRSSGEGAANSNQASQSASAPSAGSATSGQPQSARASAQSGADPAVRSQSSVGSAQLGTAAPEKAAEPSRGPARAWCYQTPKDGYRCMGPSRGVEGWGASLNGALSMVDCTTPSGYDPKPGQGGSSFSCGRELRANEQAVPTYDPYATRDKQVGTGKQP